MHDTTRLHISPLTPELLSKILPQAVRNLATDISFHELEAFPERSYGFVSLPTMEAQKLKKKANGSIIKGSKMKVEEARERRHTRRTSNEDAMEVEVEVDEDKGSKSVKKRKREDGVLQGHELAEERKVKRGWTEPTSAKVKAKREEKGKEAKEGKDKKAGRKQQTSQFSDEAECLFKTKVPPNMQDLAADKGKGKKGKKSKGSPSAVVHEFENNQKHPSFLRTAAGTDKKPVADYDDEKGWVDGEGAVVEPPRRTRSKRKTAKHSSASPEPATGSTTTAERLGSLSLKEQEDRDQTSSSGSSSGAESGSEASSSNSSSEASLPVRRSPAPQIVLEKSKSASPAPAGTHPLEALYKKPAAPASSRNRANLSVEAVPFSFFGTDAGADADDEMSSTIAQGIKTSMGPAPAAFGADDSSTTLASPPSARPKRGPAARLPNLAIPPHTPFTQRDMAWREQRSAAPTPDTAGPKKAGFGDLWRSSGGRGRAAARGGDEDDIEEEDEDEDAGAPGPAEEPESGAQGDESSEGEPAGSQAGNGSPAPRSRRGAPGEESDFVKEKYAHRGEINRAWKREMKEESKARRKAKNRRSNA